MSSSFESLSETMRSKAVDKDYNIGQSKYNEMNHTKRDSVLLYKIWHSVNLILAGDSIESQKPVQIS